MNDPTPGSRAAALASLAGLVVLKCVMLFSLLTRTQPHPPEFLAPFIGATLAVAAAAMVLLALGSRHFVGPALAFAATCVVSFGPHKLYPGENPFFFAQTPAVYPAIVVGSVLIVVLVRTSLRLRAAG